MNHPSKCEHGCYWPKNDPVNLGCQQCNPDGLGSGSSPVLPRSSGDVLGRRDEVKTNCTKCGNIRTYSSPTCRLCGTLFPEADLRGVINPANIKQVGNCPDCGSAVHYDVLTKAGAVKKSEWQCADCDTIYPAPNRAGDERDDSDED